jgi:hypothetical protein
VYCNLEGLQDPSGRLIPAGIMTQAQRPDLVILEAKGVPGLNLEKFERVLRNIDSCLVRNEHKVRIPMEYFLPANHFILLIHDLTKVDHGDLDALTNRYLRSWLGLPQGGSILLVHFGYECE